MNNDEVRRREYLQAMGIQMWQPRRTQQMSHAGHGATQAVRADVTAVDAAGVKTQVHAAEISRASPETMDWQALEHTVSECTRCSLHEGRTQAVFGVGDRNADWMFVGEAPGAQEDRKGVPFVGRAGQLLTLMLFALRLQREQVYIANVLKCRPPDNRDPMGEEVARCEPYLHRQVQLISPKIIVALGRFAAQSLLKTTQSIGKLRGRQFTYGDGIPLIVSYHPAYLLRNPLDKRKAWADLCLAQSVMRGK